MEYDKEKLIWARPKCAKEGCEEGAIAVIGNGKMLCGKCFIKYEHKRVAILTEQADRLVQEL